MTLKKDWLGVTFPGLYKTFIYHPNVFPFVVLIQFNLLNLFYRIDIYFYIIASLGSMLLFETFKFKINLILSLNLKV